MTTSESVTLIESSRSNHRGTKGTERAQSRPPTRNHQDTKDTKLHPPTHSTQRRKDAKPDHPALRAKTQQRELIGVTRFPAVGRPETAGTGLRFEPERSPRSPAPAARALGERRPRQFSSSFKSTEMGPSLGLTMGRARGRTAVPRARLPVRSVATTNARVRSSPASCRRQAIRSPAVLPPRRGRAPLPGTSPFASLRLCAFAFLSGRAALRLCVSAPLRFSCGRGAW